MEPAVGGHLIIVPATYITSKSRPSDEGRGGGHPDPEIRKARSPPQKNFFGSSGLRLVQR